MPLLTKNDIIKEISKKQIYDIDYEFAENAVKEIEFTKCHKYSLYHYKIIQSKLKK